MKIKSLILLILLVSITKISFAQYNIINKVETESKRVKIVDTLERKQTEIVALNEAYYKNQARQIRRERNQWNITNSFYLTQFSYNNWASGGENTMNGRLTANVKHIYKLDTKFDITSFFDAAYAMGTQDSILWKTEDQFQLNSALNYRMSDKFYYTFSFDMKSQFTNGYSSIGDSLPSTSILSPATINLALGLNYKLDSKRSIILSPISGNMVMVVNDRMSDLGLNGVQAGKHTQLNFGAYLQAAWTQPLIKDTKKVNNGADILSYRLSLQSFWDYKTTPNLYWQSWLDLSIYKYFSINLNATLKFDDKVTTPSRENDPSGSFWQFSEVLGIGVKYTITR